MKAIRRRWLAEQVAAALRVLPVVAVTGARQTGKTTLVRSLWPDRTYFSLDDIELLSQARKEPAALVAEPPLTLDEVQREPGLLLAVKRAVDLQRRAGDFLLTGSANLLLSQRITESLAGRAVYVELPPFCPCEWREDAGGLQALQRLFEPGFKSKDWPVVAADWPAWLVRGGLPPVLALATAAERDLWFRGYVQTFIERDLRHLSAVSNLPDFQRLMTLLAQQSGRLINQANLARDAGLSHPTAHRYLNLVEVACLMTRLPPFAANVTAGVVKSPRWFWSDCGLAAWLAGIRAPGDLRHRSDRGFWLEQTLFQTLQVWRAMAPATRRLYFWRDHSGCEVDFILAEHDRLVALEIKASTQVGVGDARGLLAFREALGRKGREVRGVVLHDGPPRPLADNIYALPFGWLVPAESKRSA